MRGVVLLISNLADGSPTVSKRIRISILPDGRVQAEVQGVKGKACTDYIGILEALLDAEAVDSAYTPEYKLEEDVSTQIEATESQAMKLRPNT